MFNGSPTGLSGNMGSKNNYRKNKKDEKMYDDSSAENTAEKYENVPF